MKQEIIWITDLRVALKDMEPWVKNPNFLRTGRQITNFSLLPREAFANWLLVAVGNHNQQNEVLTFSNDPMGGDGIIFNKQTDECIYTEHVFVPIPKESSTGSVENLIIKALNHKVKKGAAYAKGKHLVIFSEAEGLWHPNRVGRKIEGIHDFNSVWAVGLESWNHRAYRYWVTGFTGENSPVWKVIISFNFNYWRVVKIQ